MTILWILTSATVLLVSLSMFSFGKKWDPKGKHCYITGGSQGLGLALAVLLTKRGAHVSIVARNQEKLRLALEELEKHRQTPSQILAFYSFSLNDPDASAAALDAASAKHGGRAPDALFLCAGTARPGFFIEETPQSLKDAMDSIYWVQAYTALAATKRMTSGKIVFVSSILSYFSIVGYTTYSPAKSALNGLAEALRSELILYGIDVHVFLPGTMFSPGFIEENKSKPSITAKIEESDGGLQPEKCAEIMLAGVQRGNFHITVDLIGHLFRSSTRGTAPYNNVFMDSIYNIIGALGIPLWRRDVDSQILAHRKEHSTYLAEKGISHKSSILPSS